MFQSYQYEKTTNIQYKLNKSNNPELDRKMELDKQVNEPIDNDNDSVPTISLCERHYMHQKIQKKLEQKFINLYNEHEFSLTYLFPSSFFV